MNATFSIRVGGVEVVYDKRHGLSLYDAHAPQIELRISDVDLPDLVAFVCSHSQAARAATGVPLKSQPPSEDAE